LTATTLLAATLSFTLALLLFTPLSAAILLLSTLLSGAGWFTRFVWVLLCAHNAFLYC
jgi:hypothetical protein